MRVVGLPESVLHKRHNAINYHIIRESVAAEIMQVGKEDTKTNLSDLFTKVQDGNIEGIFYVSFYLNKRKDGPDKLWSRLRLPDDGHVNKSHASVNKSVVGISRIEP